MADFYQKITDMQGSVEDLIRKVPGFKGYFELEDRREADRLLRKHISQRFEELLSEFTRVEQQMISKSGLQYMERIQGIDTKLRTFIDRIDTAARGYAGVFDAIKVNEEALARLYAFDNALLTYQDQFAQGVQQLDTAGAEGIEAILTQLDKVITEANNTFNHRSEAISGPEAGV
jgi:hypothetical protein